MHAPENSDRDDITSCNDQGIPLCLVRRQGRCNISRIERRCVARVVSDHQLLQRQRIGRSRYPDKVTLRLGGCTQSWTKWREDINMVAVGRAVFQSCVHAADFAWKTIRQERSTTQTPRATSTVRPSRHGRHRRCTLWDTLAFENSVARLKISRSHAIR